MFNALDQLRLLASATYNYVYPGLVALNKYNKIKIFLLRVFSVLVYFEWVLQFEWDDITHESHYVPIGWIRKNPSAP